MSNQIEQRNDRIKTIYRLCWVGLVFAVIGFLSSIIQPASYIVMAAFGALGTQAYSPELVLYLVVQLVSAACTLFMLIFYIWSVSKKNQQQRKRRLTLFLLLQSVFSFVVFGLNLLFISVSIL